MPEPTPPRKSANFGCFTKALLIGSAAVGGGVYLMGRWETLPGAGKAGTIVLIVLGTLLVLPFILLMAVKLFIKRAIGEVAKQLKDVGGDILQNNKELFETLHDYRDATDADFDGLDRGRYETATQELNGLGYRHVSDVVNTTIENLRGITVVIRRMISIDGTTLGAIYHMPIAKKTQGLAGKTIFTCDLETEFSDGTFLVTSNTRETNLMTGTPAIHRQQYTLETPFPDLVRLHEARRMELLAATAGVTCTIVTTADEFMAFQHRQQAVKNVFRKQLGHVDPEEVRRIARTVNADPSVGDRAADAADRAAEKLRTAPPAKPLVTIEQLQERIGWSDIREEPRPEYGLRWFRIMPKSASVPPVDFLFDDAVTLLNQLGCGNWHCHPDDIDDAIEMARKLVHHELCILEERNSAGDYAGSAPAAADELPRSLRHDAGWLVRRFFDREPQREAIDFNQYQKGPHRYTLR